MSRIRTVKPELFRHEQLFDAELESGLPLRLAFIGLFTVADCEGRFRWKPRTLKLDVLPHDVVDFAAVLNALEQHGFIKSYTVDGERYGCIPSFTKHQQIPTREAERGSSLPTPPEECEQPKQEARTEHVPEHVQARTEHVPEFREGEKEGNRKGREGREGEKEGSMPAPARDARARSTPFPSDFEIGDQTRAWAEQNGFDRLDKHLEAFKGKALAKDYRYADWQQAFQNAVRDDWAGLRKPQAVPGGGRARDGKPRSADPRIAEVQDILAGLKRPVIEGECLRVTH